MPIKDQHPTLNGLSNNKKASERQAERYDSLIEERTVERNRWMLIATAELIFLFCALGLVLYALKLPKTQLDIVEVAPWGETKYIENVSGKTYDGIQVPEISIKFQIESFIINLWTLYTDEDAVYLNWAKCYAAVPKEIGKKVTSIIKGNEWEKEIGLIKRSVEIETTLKLSENTWQVDWIEKTSKISGETISSFRVRGVFTIALLNPPQKEREKNNLGIYIVDFDTSVINTIENKDK